LNGEMGTFMGLRSSIITTKEREQLWAHN
jgi:hypothetical protein